MVASRRLSRRASALAAAAATTLLGGPPTVSWAWCGADYPGQLAWDEQQIPFEREGYRGDVLVRVVGGNMRPSAGGTVLQNRVATALQKSKVDVSALTPVLVVGVPGLAFDYLENLEALAVSGRQVIFVGTCGAATAEDARMWLSALRAQDPKRTDAVVASAEVAAQQRHERERAEGL